MVCAIETPKAITFSANKSSLGCAIVHLNVVLPNSKFLWIPGLVLGVYWGIGRILIRLVNFCVPFGSLSGLTGISLIPISRCQRSRRNDNRHLLGTAEISDLSA